MILRIGISYTVGPAYKSIHWVEETMFSSRHGFNVAKSSVTSPCQRLCHFSFYVGVEWNSYTERFVSLLWFTLAIEYVNIPSVCVWSWHVRLWGMEMNATYANVCIWVAVCDHLHFVLLRGNNKWGEINNYCILSIKRNLIRCTFVKMY